MGHNGCDGSQASGPWAIGSGYRFKSNTKKKNRDEEGKHGEDKAGMQQSQHLKRVRCCSPYPHPTALVLPLPRHPCDALHLQSRSGTANAKQCQNLIIQ